MPLRITDGIEIPIEPILTSELWGGLLESLMEVIPEEGMGGAGTSGERLEIPWFEQEKKLWCWAACTQMVLRFFGTYLKQCEIARRNLHKSCCGSVPYSYCNKDRTVDGVGAAFDSVELKSFVTAHALSFVDIQEEVNSEGGPVVAGIEWEDGGGHLVVVNGWKVANNIRYVKVNDPIYGHGYVRYSDLRNSYGPVDNGKWTYTWRRFRL